MATFYFNAAVDSDWQTLGNWWMAYNAGTDTHSVPATALPTSTDDIEVRGNISGNSGSEPTVANASFFGGSYIEAVSITITGNCTFNDSSGNYGTITGDCTFNDSSITDFGGTINGNCTLNDNSYNGQYDSTTTINGNCTFNHNSYNRGTINGNCTFNHNSYNRGTINGDCTFNNSSYNGGTINGNCTFNDNSSAFSYTSLSIINGIARFSISSAIAYIDNEGFGLFDGGVEIIYDKGINGSSILGVV